MWCWESELLITAIFRGQGLQPRHPHIGHYYLYTPKTQRAYSQRVACINPCTRAHTQHSSGPVHSWGHCGRTRVHSSMLQVHKGFQMQSTAAILACKRHYQHVTPFCGRFQGPMALVLPCIHPQRRSVLSWTRASPKPSKRPDPRDQHRALQSMAQRDVVALAGSLFLH